MDRECCLFDRCPACREFTNKFSQNLNSEHLNISMMTTRLVVVTLSSVSRKVFSAFLCPFLQDIALLWLMKVCGSISLDNTIFILNFFQQDSPLHKCHLGFYYALENQFWIHICNAFPYCLNSMT